MLLHQLPKVCIAVWVHDLFKVIPTLSHVSSAQAAIDSVANKSELPRHQAINRLQIVRHQRPIGLPQPQVAQ